MIDQTIIGFISVRTSSSRLPKKCLLPFGTETVISHIINRALSYGITPILCTSTSGNDDVLVSIAKELKIKYFRGSLENKLKRWLDCAREHDIKKFHTIDADDPFFDGDEMIDSMKMLANKDLDVVCPTESSASGGASVGYSITTSIIEKALQNIPDDADTEMMWYFVEKVNGVKMYNMPDRYSNSAKVRLTLDYEEDYWMLASLVNILGNKVTRNEINMFLLNNPDFTKINFFRNEEWNNAQLSKKI